MAATVALVASLLWWAGRRQRGMELRAEAASRAAFQSLVENGADVMSVFDTSGVLIYVSPASDRVLGHRPEDIIDRNLALELLHPEDRAVFDVALRQCVEIRASVVGPLEFRLCHSDGQWRWLEGNL